jgi:hypothetical protein
MYICPPAEKVYIFNNYNYVPYTMGGFKILPNYDIKDKESKKAKIIDSMVDDFVLSRMQIDQTVDLNIMTESPIVKKARWLGKLQMEVGFQ